MYLMYVFNFIVVGEHSIYIFICEASRSLRVLGSIKCVFIIIIILNTHIVFLDYKHTSCHEWNGRKLLMRCNEFKNKNKSHFDGIDQSDGDWPMLSSRGRQSKVDWGGTHFAVSAKSVNKLMKFAQSAPKTRWNSQINIEYILVNAREDLSFWCLKWFEMVKNTCS